MGKNKRRPTTYKDWITKEGLAKLQSWARDGLTNEQITYNIGIHPSTIYEWMNKYPEIREALSVKAFISEREIENALLNTSLGHTESTNKLKTALEFEIGNDNLNVRRITDDKVLKELDDSNKHCQDITESEFEDHIYKNINKIIKGLGLSEAIETYNQKQFRLPDMTQIIPDIVVAHKDGTVTVLEIKKWNKKYPSTATFNQAQGVGQCLLYQNVVQAYTGKPTRVIMVDEKIHSRTLLVFSGNDLSISLMEVQGNHVRLIRNRLHE